MRVLVLQFEAPLMSFGSEAIDQNGPTRDWPDASLVTGLLANALGFRREEAARHQRLQDRLRFAVRIDREGAALRDFQTAKLEKSDSGWTTHGAPEGRAGGAGSYSSPHLRFRHYRADASLLVALTLDEADEPPTLERCLTALEEPARPLFIGRKPCLPSGPLARGVIDAASLLEAFGAFPPEDAPKPEQRFVLAPEDAEGWPAVELRHLTGRRDWTAGVHAGLERRVVLRRTSRSAP